MIPIITSTGLDNYTGGLNVILRPKGEKTSLVGLLGSTEHGMRRGIRLLEFFVTTSYRYPNVRSYIENVKVTDGSLIEVPLMNSNRYRAYRVSLGKGSK